MSWSLDPRRPKPQQDPKGWYEFWEEELEWFYSRPEDPIVKDSKANDYLPYVTEGVLTTLYSLRQTIAQYRQTVSLIWISSYSKGNPVDALWAAKGRQGREDIMLKALVEFVTDFCDDTCMRENAWMWCPEVKMQTMCEGDGEAFIAVLKHFLVKDTEVQPSLDFPILREPRLWRLADFSDDKSIEARRPEGVRAYHNRILVMRHFFLISFVQSLIHLLLDLPHTTNIIHIPKTKKTTEQKALWKSAPRLETEAKSAVDAEKKRLKPLRKLLGSADSCATCGKLDNPKKLMACRGCRDVGRRILYCSVECQKKDYKNGQPPHKKICSKLLREIPFDFASDPIPEPDPFPLYTSTPSAALLLQLHYLKRESFVYDYNLNVHDGRVLYQTFHGDAKRIFLSARKNAMEKRDLGSIAVMELLLHGSTEDYRSYINVVNQLQNEYEVRIEDCREAAKSNSDFRDFSSTKMLWLIK